MKRLLILIAVVIAVVATGALIEYRHPSNNTAAETSRSGTGTVIITYHDDMPCVTVPGVKGVNGGGDGGDATICGDGSAIGGAGGGSGGLVDSSGK
jgi:hypothetical protein